MDFNRMYKVMKERFDNISHDLPTIFGVSQTEAAEMFPELPLQMSASMTKAIPNTRQMLDIISSVIFYTPIDGSLKQILTP